MMNSFAEPPAVGAYSLLLPQTLETFAADCVTPKDTFVLGDTVCGQVNGAALPFFGFRQRRFQWVDPSGAVVQLTDVTTDPQNDTFTVPTTGQLAQVGTWTLRIIKNNGNTDALVRFFVGDPANLRADLSVGKYGQIEVKSGTNARYFISVENRGPDAAQGVSLTDDVPANMTFVSVTQTSGPAFSCSNPSSGGTGTSTCTLATMPRGESATFTFIYEVIPGTPIGTTIDNTVNVSSSTTELNPADNSATAPVSVTGVGTGGGDCVITCPEDITVVAGAGQAGAIVTYEEPTTTGSSCGAISCSQSSDTFFPIGTTTVVCAAETGEPCSFNVTVTDEQNPTISCPADISVSEDTPGSGSATVNYSPSASDNSGVVSVSCDQASGSSFPVGTTTVTCTATDDSGNNASCSFSVTVTGTGCILTCPADIVVNAPAGSCEAVVSYPAPTGSGECDPITSMPASGSTFPVGTTTVEVTSGSQTCSFTVTVVGGPPTITCPAAMTVDAPSGSCSAIVDPGTPTVTDNCQGGVEVLGSRSDGEPLDQNYPVGITVITWIATDTAGNSSSCEQIITVRDPLPPTVSANVPPAVATVTADANCQALIPDITEFVTVTYNCTPTGSLTITQSPVAGTVVGNGSHTITITVIEGDPEGPHNTLMGTTTFTVNDAAPPVITLNGDNPIVVECHTSFTDPGATAHDTCAGDFAATVSGAVDVDVPGSYTLTYNASDPSGNAASPVTRTVNVVDTTAPVITLNGANPMTVECHTSFTDPGATAHDTCAGDFAATVSGAVNVNVPGSYTLTYNASDPTGNAASSVTRTVNVVDTTAPTITMTGLQINLWPPNHNYHTINLTQLVASASDGCDGGLDINDVVIFKVTSDETENGGGDGNTFNDIVIAANCKSVQLRAERNGGGNGRVYTIHFRATDASGNVTTKTAQVKVPKSQGNNGGAIDSGVQYTVNGTCP